MSVGRHGIFKCLLTGILRVRMKNITKISQDNTCTDKDYSRTRPE